jgi:predicted GTPase
LWYQQQFEEILGAKGEIISKEIVSHREDDMTNTVVAVGETGSGKSFLLNALLMSTYLPSYSSHPLEESSKEPVDKGFEPEALGVIVEPFWVKIL